MADENLYHLFEQKRGKYVYTIDVSIKEERLHLRVYEVSGWFNGTRTRIHNDSDGVFSLTNRKFVSDAAKALIIQAEGIIDAFSKNARNGNKIKTTLASVATELKAAGNLVAFQAKSAKLFDGKEKNSGVDSEQVASS